MPAPHDLDPNVETEDEFRARRKAEIGQAFYKDMLHHPAKYAEHWEAENG